MMKTLKQIQNEIIRWGKKFICYQLLTVLTVVVIIFVGICFYRDLVIRFGDWFFKDPEATRNIIYFFAALFGGYLLYRRTKAAEEEVSISKQNIEIAKQNREDSEQNRKEGEKKIIEERINLATQQIENDSLTVRLNAISSLRRIANIHEEEQKQISRLLVSFIRTYASKDSKKFKTNLQTMGFLELENADAFSEYRAERLDVEIAVNALANITSKLEKRGQFQNQYNETKYQLCDLQNTDLRGLRFSGADLSKFDLAGADMSGTSLVGVNLSEAWLYKPYTAEGTKLVNAFLEDVNFRGAHLDFVDFHGVGHLRGVDFSGAYLHGANFTGVQMIEANLSNAVLENVDFTKAFLSEVKIDGATLKNANLTDANFSNMHGLRQWQIEEAFRRNRHHTYITSAEGYSLKSPPEEGSKFWVYENWNSKDTTHARIHVPRCHFCNYGKGMNKDKKSQGATYRWVGCDTYDEALKILEDFRKEHNCEDVGNCKSCEDKRDLPPPSVQS